MVRKAYEDPFCYAHLRVYNRIKYFPNDTNKTDDRTFTQLTDEEKRKIVREEE